MKVSNNVNTRNKHEQHTKSITRTRNSYKTKYPIENKQFRFIEE